MFILTTFLPSFYLLLFSNQSILSIALRCYRQIILEISTVPFVFVKTQTKVAILFHKLITSTSVKYSHGPPSILPYSDYQRGNGGFRTPRILRIPSISTVLLGFSSYSWDFHRTPEILWIPIILLGFSGFLLYSGDSHRTPKKFSYF